MITWYQTRLGSYRPQEAQSGALSSSGRLGKVLLPCVLIPCVPGSMTSGENIIEMVSWPGLGLSNKQSSTNESLCGPAELCLGSGAWAEDFAFAGALSVQAGCFISSAQVI